MFPSSLIYIPHILVEENKYNNEISDDKYVNGSELSSESKFNNSNSHYMHLYSLCDDIDHLLENLSKFW